VWSGWESAVLNKVFGFVTTIKIPNVRKKIAKETGRFSEWGVSQSWSTEGMGGRRDTEALHDDEELSIMTAIRRWH
jgi:hypothetical protein